MYRIMLTSPLLIGVAACGGSVLPVTFATPGDIAVQYDAATGTNVPSQDYATTYYARNLRACTNYFNGLVAKSNDAAKFEMIGGAAGAAAGAAGGPIGLLGGLAAGTALGSGLLNAEAAPGGELPVAGYTLWQRQYGAYLAAAPTPQDQATAQLLGDANAALCTPIGIQASAAAAMMSAPVVVMPQPGPVIMSSPMAQPIVNPTILGEATLTPPGTPLPHHRRHARTTQPSQEELQFRAIQQYGRNAVEGGQRVLPPMVCVGCMK